MQSNADVSFEPLTPLAYLDRSASVFGGRTAVVDGERSLTYAELADRAWRQAGMLAELGVESGDRVAVLSPNTTLLLESHYGVPAAGAVLVALNTRLSLAELHRIVDHSGAHVLLCDGELASVAEELRARSPRLEAVVDTGDGGEYERRIDAASPMRAGVSDERALLSINYTSGTTGQPKGVMYHHRGAYLQALAMAFHSQLAAESAFLWTLPMFHCNGWCFTWAVTAAGARHVCLRRLDPAAVWQLLRQERVTHLNAAPTVLTMIAHAPEASPLDQRLRICTGGAPPSPSLIERLEGLAMSVTHLYGLTETFGPIMICDPQPEWATLPPHEQAALTARQGVGNVIACQPRVIDDAGHDVAADGAAIGEIAVRGNDLMLGYYRAEELTQEAFEGGWFRTGDLAVRHPDGYVEIRDRSKDVIISGGENIASIEVEQALVSHPAVLEAAVIAAPDAFWGEVPVAFVDLVSGATVGTDELIEHVKSRLARFKAPRRIVFGPLPKTSTGKVMKYALRDELWADQERHVH